MVVLPLFVLVTSLLVFVFRQGIELVAAALSLAYTLQPLLLIFIMRRWKLGLDAWRGWSWECIYDWKPYIMLAIPGVLTVCMEWWSYEIGTLVAGSVDKLESASIIISLNLVSICYLIPSGISTAASVRVGNLLGAGKPLEAKRAAWVAYGVAVILAMSMCTLIFSLRHVIGGIFSSDQDVVNLTAKLLTVVAVSELFDFTQATFIVVLAVKRNSPYIN
eukprot:m.66288 g.66288  ORF g.66288 m.66288 type:complete len:219 (+) comp35378_c0_seq2:214-870(+)